MFYYKNDERRFSPPAENMIVRRSVDCPTGKVVTSSPSQGSPTVSLRFWYAPPIPETTLILLANLCQSSKADISAQDFLGSSVFKEAIYGVKFPALRGSPTVSGGF